MSDAQTDALYAAREGEAADKFLDDLYRTLIPLEPDEPVAPADLDRLVTTWRQTGSREKDDAVITMIQKLVARDRGRWYRFLQMIMDRGRDEDVYPFFLLSPFHQAGWPVQLSTAPYFNRITGGLGPIERHIRAQLGLPPEKGGKMGVQKHLVVLRVEVIPIPPPAEE